MQTQRRDIERALEQFETPFYLFDERAIRDQIAHVRSMLPSRVRLCYAMKASSFALPEAARCVELVEVCSEGEYRICEKLGVPDSNIVISGVNKDEDFICELVSGHPGIARYTAESLIQLDMLERASAEAGRSIAVLVRLTSGNQFGMDRSDVFEAIRRMKACDTMTFSGIQYFSGTQKTSSAKHKRELAKLDRLIARIHDELEVDVIELEYGGGLPVEYFDPDREANRRMEDGIVEGLSVAIDAMTYTGPINLELGRSLVASCGSYATRIVDAKTNKGNNFAIVDGGMHQIVYYGHAMALQQPLCHLEPPRDEGDVKLWNICGSLCTTNDILAKQLPLTDVAVGDVLVFEKAGAYCMTEGLSLFLSRDLPRVIMIDCNGEFHLVRDRIETFGLNTPASRI